MKVSVGVTAWIDGAELTLKTQDTPALVVMTQPEAEALIIQLTYALSVAIECDVVATEVLRNNHEFKRNIEVQSG